MAQGARSIFGVPPRLIWGRGAGYWGAVRLPGMLRRAVLKPGVKSFRGFCCCFFFFSSQTILSLETRNSCSPSSLCISFFFFFFSTLFGRKMKPKPGSVEPAAVQLASGRTVRGRAASSRVEFGADLAVLGDFSIRCHGLRTMGKLRHGLLAPSHPEPAAGGLWGQGSMCAKGIWGLISELERLEAAWNRATGRDFVQK